MATRGQWNLNKPLYRPTYELFRLLAAPFGLRDPRAVLELVSIATSAASVALVWAAARVAGSARLAAFGSALLFAVTPTVWFFATNVEVHPPQLLAAAAGALWLSWAWRRDRLGEDALGLAILLVALTATHPTGAFYGPGLLALALVARSRGRRVRRIVPALLLCAGFALYVKYGISRTDLVGLYERNLIDLAERPESRWNPRVLLDGLQGAALLVPLAALHLARRPWRARPADRALLVPLAVLFATFALLLPSFGVGQRGAYYASLLPVLALGSALFLARLPPALLLPALLASIACQGWLAQRWIHEFHHRFSPEEWVAALESEAGEGTVVLVKNPRAEGGPIARFSTMFPMALTRVFLSQPPETLVTWASRRGRRLAVTRSLWEDPALTPEQAQYLRGLAALLGEPQPAGRPEYLLFPARVAGDAR
jgi:hypothetical protein